MIEMKEALTEDTKVIIMLCGVFGKKLADNPLSTAEYMRLVHWLMDRKIRPSDLLERETLNEASSGANIGKQRMEALLSRGVQLGFAMEEWQGNNIWVMSRSDTDYPARYKKKFSDKAPPLLFGTGDRSLLQGGGMAIVGSRNVDEKGEAFARHVAQMCSYNRMPVVSGGARGVDRISMSAALEAGGVVVGVLAENLLKLSLEKHMRYAIGEGHLLLFSSNSPEAGFNVGAAMGRNKLIYAMADFGLVVSSEFEKGGTWAGAVEELKREKRIPVFVRVSDSPPEGNAKLLDLGAIPWPEDIDRSGFKQCLIDTAAQSKEDQTAKEPMPEIQPREKRNEKPVTLPLFSAPTEQASAKEEEHNAVNVSVTQDGSGTASESVAQELPQTIYQAVLPIILSRLDLPVSLNDLALALNVTKPQMSAWLKKAADERIIVKLLRPVRYQRKE